jgi:hypothetical protein
MGHVLRVVDAVTTDDEKLAAALHDLLEDTILTSTDLLAAGCPPRIIAAVEALTRKSDEDYEVFLGRAASDPIARAVKFADVSDNADASRLSLLEPEDADRLRSKYARARVVLDRAPLRTAETERRIQESEFAELGIPSGDPDVWRTFWCTACGRPAGTIALIGDNAVLATFLGRMTTKITGEGSEELRAVLARGDAETLCEHDVELAPFWCRECKLTYCGGHWLQETVFDDGFFDEIRGVCPAGHSRLLWD